MIVVESYLMTGPGVFVSFESGQAHSKEADLIEGAIEIVIDDCVLIDVRLWDYVYPLWAYLADAVSRLRATGAGSFRFPDQPVQVDLERMAKGRVQVAVSGDGDKRKAVASEFELIQALRSRGSDFFGRVSTWFPAERSVIGNSWTKLMHDPAGASLADIRWEERVGRVQASAFSQAERMVGQRMSVVQRERLISDVAGRRLSFGELLSRAESALRCAPSGGS
ncbi:hypothetical protein [Promicromonospora sp. NPDC059942]|uniref:hypothetical protein n=1 Tax=Promicromonospora sp. NPDC059942 TaxID=3347009 RepID=UPI003669263F